ncbi:hypothetical protein ykris0001_7940 [Yersinia kristensenii ATCC 33638]|nr:hypothetical protein ykris0001_7940 [Yersinia kristensenii ATCC 33638]
MYLRGTSDRAFSLHIDPNHLKLTKIVQWLIFTVSKVTILGF